MAQLARQPTRGDFGEDRIRPHVLYCGGFSQVCRTAGRRR
jgi:hypothetical protein